MCIRNFNHTHFPLNDPVDRCAVAANGDRRMGHDADAGRIDAAGVCSIVMIDDRQAASFGRSVVSESMIPLIWRRRSSGLRAKATSLWSVARTS